MSDLKITLFEFPIYENKENHSLLSSHHNQIVAYVSVEICNQDIDIVKYLLVNSEQCIIEKLDGQDRGSLLFQRHPVVFFNYQSPGLRIKEWIIENVIKCTDELLNEDRFCDIKLLKKKIEFFDVEGFINSIR